MKIQPVKKKEPPVQQEKVIRQEVEPVKVEPVREPTKVEPPKTVQRQKVAPTIAPAVDEVYSINFSEGGRLW